MKLTIIQVGETPGPMLGRFPRYPEQFQAMFARAGAVFAYETVRVLDGEPLPDPAKLEGIVVPGSAAGVYDRTEWMEPLRAFIRAAYGAGTPMLGVCFGHQVMADALGGTVRKSEKGWGIGRHVYELQGRPDFMRSSKPAYAIAASHQDQVVTAPDDAEVFLASEFTPNAGLVYRNGAAVSLQPHPEFDLAFARGLVELRRNNPLTDDEVAAAGETFADPLDHDEMGRHLTRFFLSR